MTKHVKIVSFFQTDLLSQNYDEMMYNLENAHIHIFGIQKIIKNV